MTNKITTTPSAKKVLIVDDNRDIAKLFDLILRKEGFETTMVYSGIDAGVELSTSPAPDKRMGRGMDVIMTSIPYSPLTFC